ncbi:MAG: hypothetical protein WC659_03640 [Patescibacteria group bacterium]
MKLSVQKHSAFRLLVAGAALALVLVSVGANLTMRMDEQGMSGCPFAPQHKSSFCPMNVGSHLMEWRALFASAPLWVTLLLMSLTMFIAIVVWHLTPMVAESPPSRRFLLYERFVRDSKWYSYLVRAYAGGVLNPRVYASI